MVVYWALDWCSPKGGARDLVGLALTTWQGQRGHEESASDSQPGLQGFLY